MIIQCDLSVSILIDNKLIPKCNYCDITANSKISSFSQVLNLMARTKFLADSKETDIAINYAEEIIDLLQRWRSDAASDEMGQMPRTKTTVSTNSRTSDRRDDVYEFSYRAGLVHTWTQFIHVRDSSLLQYLDEGFDKKFVYLYIKCKAQSDCFKDEDSQVKQSLSCLITISDFMGN